MRNRPYWAIALEVLTQYLFYAQPFWDPREVMFWLAAKFDGNINKMITIVTLLVLNGAWIIPSIVFIFIYRSRIPFLEKYKIQEWVWEKPQSIRTEQYRALIRKTFEAFVVTQIGISVGVYYAFQAKMAASTPEDYVNYLKATPVGLQAFPKFILCIFVFETCFYWGHRFLHTKVGYQFHKDHHAYYTPISNAGNWGHWVDGVLSLPFPAIFPVIFFDMHVYTLWMWAIMHIFHSQYDHCGYDFPYNPIQLIPFGSHTDAHNFHHSHVVDNFGLYWRLWDYIMGTNKFWNKFCDDREELEKAARAGKADSDMRIVNGQALVRNVAEERDMASGTDKLTFTYTKHGMEKYMSTDSKALNGTGAETTSGKLAPAAAAAAGAVPAAASSRKSKKRD